ncbi:glycosyltransferase [Candidatus Micrarchaeota archaeon]|nr:glycosyltransferase [Candidatus Micrarchaeota archaeon]
MKASVIVAALNEERALASCLKSIRAQSLQPFEVIVADGNSEDNTRSVAARFADKVVVEKHRTISAGRQKGSDAAVGEVLVFADADTHYPRHWLSSLLSPFSRSEVICTQGKLLVQDATFLEHFVADHVAPWYFKAALKLGFPSGAGSNLAVRSDAFRKAGGFNRELVTAEDIDLQKRLLPLGENVFVDEAVAFISPRRFREWGYRKYVGFHMKNMVRFARGKETKKHYEPVR